MSSLAFVSFNNDDPRKLLLKYVPILIKRREGKEKLFEIIEASEDKEDRREAFEKLRTTVKIPRSVLEIFEYNKLSLADLRLKSKGLGLSFGGTESKFRILFGEKLSWLNYTETEEFFYSDDSTAAGIYGNYNSYLYNNTSLLTSGSSVQSLGKGSLYYYLDFKKYNTNIDYPARTSSCYDYDEEIYEFIAGLMHEKYDEGKDGYIGWNSTVIMGKRGDIRAKDRITQELNESGVFGDYRKELQDMLRGIEKIQRKEREDTSFISEKGRDLFKP